MSEQKKENKLPGSGYAFVNLFCFKLFLSYINCGMKWLHSLEIPINLLMNVFQKFVKF